MRAGVLRSALKPFTSHMGTYSSSKPSLKHIILYSTIYIYTIMIYYISINIVYRISDY